MAITLAELAETPSTANTTSYATGSYAPTANRCLIAIVAASGTVAATPTFAGNGLTWTLDAVRNGATHSFYSFHALTGASPTATAGTFDCTGDAATGCGITVIEVTGGNLTTPVTQFKVNNGAGATTPTFTFAAPTASDCAIIAATRNQTNPNGETEPTGYTETTDSGYDTPTIGWEVAWHASPGAVSTVTWGATSTAWDAIGVELKIAGGTNATATPATVAVIAAIPAPTVKAAAIATPATVAAVASVPAPTILAGAIASPATVAVVGVVPAPSIKAGAIATPSTIAVIASVPAPTVKGAAIATPATVAVIALVPAPSVYGAALATPSTVAVIVSVPAPTVRGNAIATPATVAVIIVIPTPSVIVVVIIAPGTADMRVLTRFTAELASLQRFTAALDPVTRFTASLAPVERFNAGLQPVGRYTAEMHLSEVTA